MKSTKALKLLCKQCALLALCSVHIMSYSESVLPPSPAFSALMVFSYGGIIFNCTAAVASLVMVDKIGSVPLWGARRSLDPPHAGWMSANIDILDRFGIGSSWGWIVGYCKCVFLSVKCLFTDEWGLRDHQLLRWVCLSGRASFHACVVTRGYHVSQSCVFGVISLSTIPLAALALSSLYFAFC